MQTLNFLTVIKHSIFFQLSYAASSVEFQDEFKYLFLFTNVPSTSAFNKARLSLIQYFGWKRVAILREYDDQLHTQVTMRPIINSAFKTSIENFKVQRLGI